MPPRLLGTCLVLTAASLWGSFGFFAKKLYSFGYSPLEVASLRTWIAWLTLGLFMLVRRRGIRIQRRDIRFYLIYGVLVFTLFELLFFATLERAPVAVASALLYTAPAFVLVIAALRGDERLDARRVGLLGLVLIGVTLVTGAARTLASGAAHVSATAVGFGLCAGLTYGVFTIMSKYALTRYDSMRNNFWVFGISALALGIAAPPWRVLGEPASWPWLAGIGILLTVVAYAFYMAGLRYLPASTVALLASAEPVIAAILGFLLLGEALSFDRIVGIGLIVLAAAVLASTHR